MSEVHRNSLFVIVGLVLTVSAPGFGRRQPPATADLILTNGKIITVDDRRSIVQAVAVRGDRILATGTNQEIARLAGPDTRRIDLRGRAVMPGLHTRNNTYRFFRNSDLGSIQPGRFADIVVLDRDYLTIPGEEITDITPVMTVVGGRIMHGSGQ